jgi:hypothetical protein
MDNVQKLNNYKQQIYLLYSAIDNYSFDNSFQNLFLK